MPTLVQNNLLICNLYERESSPREISSVFLVIINTDVNECDTPSLNNCGQVCENNNGSFTCSCDDGFTLESDNKTCSGIELFFCVVEKSS